MRGVVFLGFLPYGHGSRKSDTPALPTTTVWNFSARLDFHSLPAGEKLSRILLVTFLSCTRLMTAACLRAVLRRTLSSGSKNTQGGCTTGSSGSVPCREGVFRRALIEIRGNVQAGRGEAKMKEVLLSLPATLLIGLALTASHLVVKGGGEGDAVILTRHQKRSVRS